jgi:hypothetical protein
MQLASLLLKEAPTNHFSNEALGDWSEIVSYDDGMYRSLGTLWKE